MERIKYTLLTLKIAAFPINALSAVWYKTFEFDSNGFAENTTDFHPRDCNSN